MKRVHSSEPVFQHDFFKTTSVTDFVLKNLGSAPKDYPSEKKIDPYTKFPFEEAYTKRREQFFDHCLNNPSQKHIKGFFYELVRIYKDHTPIYEDIIFSALDYINNRLDCADFVMLGIMRMLYQLKGKKLLSQPLIDKAEATLLSFKYWPDEPGIDSMCYWTENHQIMFSVNEYLAGQYFPAETFSNSGMSGIEKKEKSKIRIEQWMRLRYETGFNEWLSNIYYDEDLTALINLVDFCDDSILVEKAKMILDLMLLDIALNQFYGCFVSTHGRCYTKEKKDALKESTIDTTKLLFGMGKFAGADNMSAVALALSENYRMPRVIYKIATDFNREEMISKQRIGIKIKDAPKWGLPFGSVETAMVLLSFEAYAHYKNFSGVIKLMDHFRWWENQFFPEFKQNRFWLKFGAATGLIKPIAYFLRKDLSRNTREENHILTYRTPDYMLSTSQDYQKGFGGDQQHIWQATLDTGVVCFTTHPASYEDTPPGYWIGSGFFPRPAQIQNLAVIVYHLPSTPTILIKEKLPFTHAYFPRDMFDDVIEENGWVFGRKGDGYIALYSQKPYQWQDKGDDKNREILAYGKKNIWICEMGRKKVDGAFHQFIKNISLAELKLKTNRVIYHSPSQGKIEFGWRGKLKQNGKEIPLKNYPRYDNPYVQTGFPLKKLALHCKGDYLNLDYDNLIRECNQCI